MTNHNIFILGAGFTKSIFDGAPLNDELLNALLDFNPASPLRTLSESYATDNIELLLSKLDLDIQKGQNSSETRDEINRQIATYFQRFRFIPDILNEKSWLRQFALNCFRQNDIILNLNYETFLEGLLDYLDVWRPKKGYGVVDNMLVDEALTNPHNIQILKIHGSEHFTSKPYGDKPESIAISFEFNPSIFPKSAAHSFLGSRSLPTTALNASGPYVIAPSYVKIPAVEINYLMIDAIQAVNNADNVFIIGCGLRAEDTFLTLLLTSFLRKPNWQDRRIIILDPKAKNIADRLRKYWGVNINACIVEKPFTLESSIDDLCKLINQNAEHSNQPDTD